VIIENAIRGHRFRSQSADAILRTDFRASAVHARGGSAFLDQVLAQRPKAAQPDLTYPATLLPDRLMRSVAWGNDVRRRWNPVFCRRRRNPLPLAGAAGTSPAEKRLEHPGRPAIATRRIAVASEPNAYGGHLCLLAGWPLKTTNSPEGQPLTPKAQQAEYQQRRDSPCSHPSTIKTFMPG